MPSRWSGRLGHRGPAPLMHKLAVERVEKHQIRAVLDEYARCRLIDVGCGVEPYERFFDDAMGTGHVVVGRRTDCDETGGRITGAPSSSRRSVSGAPRNSAAAITQ